MKYSLGESCRLNRGMTLAEVVIAIAVIAFTIPLILAASGSALRSRKDAEIATRAAWLVRDVQRNIHYQWSDTAGTSSSVPVFPFPTEGQSIANMEMICKQDGTLISDGSTSSKTKQAVYLVTVEAKSYQDPLIGSPGTPLAIISIKIQHPAHADPKKRKTLKYQYISTKEGVL